MPGADLSLWLFAIVARLCGFDLRQGVRGLGVILRCGILCRLLGLRGLCCSRCLGSLLLGLLAFGFVDQLLGGIGSGVGILRSRQHVLCHLLAVIADNVVDDGGRRGL